MVASEKINFPFAQKLVQICSYIIFAAVLYGIAWAYIPAILGAPWSTAYLRSQYPRWDDFLTLRAKRAPNDIFFSSYWRQYFDREKA